MEDQKCECGMPLTSSTKCVCNEETCIYCCTCDKDCSCGCSEKVEKENESETE